MATTEALKSGATTLAETAADAVTGLAEKAAEKAKDTAGSAKELVTERIGDRISERKQSHRGRSLLLGAALIAAGAAAFRYLRARFGGHSTIKLWKTTIVTATR